jgi:ribosomal subunit interface protein
MDITTKARHWKPGATFRTFAEERMRKLERFYPSLIHAEITVTKESFRYTAEINLHGSTIDLVTKAVDADPGVALDAAFAKLEKALARHADRLKDRKKRGATRPVEPATIEAPPLPSTRAAGGISVVRAKARTPTLSAEQAARALLKSNKPVLVFSERGTEAGLRVAYRIGDREVGLLELD